jgi:uncharacterized membrane protein YgcG
MSTVGLERRWDRTARIRARIGLRGPLILLCAGLVFASFFAIGRATRAGGGAPAEGAASLSVASVRAPVPVRLQTATPIETTLLPPPPPRKAKPFSAPSATVPLQTTTPEASRAVTPSPRVSEPVAPAPAPAPVRESAPSRPSGSGSSGGGGHHSSSGSGSGGGGTFESSG